MKSARLICVTAVAVLFLLNMSVPVPSQEISATTSKHHHFKFIDIGTFGGPASFINNVFAFGAPNQINVSGLAVGSSGTSDSTPADSTGFVCGGVDGSLPFVFHAFKWQDGDVTDLGALPGDGNCSIATSINSRGEIVGQSEIDVDDPLFGTREVRAVLWKDGNITNLGTFGGRYSVVGSINNHGQISGLATNSIADPYSILYQIVGSSQGTQTRAFLWENGHKRDLGTLGGPDAQAGFLNDDGKVVGVSYVNSTPNSVTGFPTLHPFLWHKGRMKDLGTLGGFGSPGSATLPPTVGVSGLNNRGQVIGVSPLAGDLIAHPFLWDDGNLFDLNVQSGGLISTADAINDARQIVGNANFPNGASDAYLWQDGVFTDLGTLSGDCFSEAFAINSRGQVVGQSYSCVSNTVRTFLWESGSIVDLNNLIPPDSGFELIEALAINDRGEIGGIADPPGCANLDDADCGHAFLLIPCDENHASIEGCDYSEVEESASAIRVDSPPVEQNPITPITMNPGVLPGRVNPMMRSFGRRSMPWYRKLGVQPPSK